MRNGGADVVDLQSRREKSRPIVTLHLSEPVEWDGARINDIHFSDVDAGKLAFANEPRDAAFAAVAAAVVMTKHPPEMLQKLADVDSARLLFVALALIDHGEV